MRKYNKKTKITIGIVIGLILIIVIIFFLFINKAREIDKIEYQVYNNSILFDADRNMINTTNNGNIKIKWGGNYYLVYNDENYNLGKHSIVYNSNTGRISLYGTFYEILKSGKYTPLEKENIIESSVNSRFFKLADRKYLIIDRTIESSDAKFVTSNYLIIELDKLGNATLYNDKVSIKTIKPTILNTSSYSFDIANEKINFGGEDIDLKEIIGSTNLYDPDTYDLNATDDDSIDNNGSNGGANNNGSGSGNGGGAGNNNGTGNNANNGVGGNNNANTNGGVANGNTAGSTSQYNNDYSSNVSDNAVQNIIKATTSTSIIRVTPSISSISVDYVVYDPNSEYSSVYIEVENSNTGNINTIYLSKTDTNVTINDLTPNATYNLKFKYNTSTETTTFDEVDAVKTILPDITMSVNSITSKKLNYTISFDNNYSVMSGQVQIYINGKAIEPVRDNISVLGSVNKINRSVDISGFDVTKGDTVVVKLTSLQFNTYSTVTNTNTGLAMYSFKY